MAHFIINLDIVDVFSEEELIVFAGGRKVLPVNNFACPYPPGSTINSVPLCGCQSPGGGGGFSGGGYGGGSR